MLAVDEDIGDQLEYTIVPDGSAYSNYVKVHPKQGIVSLQKPVRELGFVFYFLLYLGALFSNLIIDTVNVYVVSRSTIGFTIGFCGSGGSADV